MKRVSQMWQGARAFLRPKTEVDADLRHRLLDVITPRGDAEFAAHRLIIYKKIDEFPVLSRRSPVGTTTSLRSIYYARFYTSFSLLQAYMDDLEAVERRRIRKVRSNDYVPNLDPELAKLASTVYDKVKNSGPTERFKQATDSVLLDASKRTEADLSKSDTYESILATHFKDLSVAKQFLEVEQDLFDLVAASNMSTVWAHRFNAFNRNTASYAERHIRPDVRRLMKASQRFSEAANRSQGVIASGALFVSFLAFLYPWWSSKGIPK